MAVSQTLQGQPKRGNRALEQVGRHQRLQLILECFKGVDREAGGCDLEPGTGVQGVLQVVAEQPADVVDDLHGAAPCSSLAASMAISSF